MRLIIFIATIAVLLIADQVRTGGHYRREVLFAIERSCAGFRTLPGGPPLTCRCCARSASGQYAALALTGEHSADQDRFRRHSTSTTRHIRR